MWRYIVRRVLIALALVFVVTTIIFLVIHIIPGDPAMLLLSGGGVDPSPEAVAALRKRLGLDLPLWTQYVDYVASVLQGDFGTSFQDDYPVGEEIAKRLPRTLELIVAATLISIITGVPLGILAALRHGKVVDRTLALGAGLMLSVPVFVTGTLMVLLFAQTLRWVPAGGFVTFSRDPLQHLVFLAMPAATIAIGFSAAIFRITRTTVLETLQRDWVRTARAKGLPGNVVIRRQGNRHRPGRGRHRSQPKGLPYRIPDLVLHRRFLDLRQRLLAGRHSNQRGHHETATENLSSMHGETAYGANREFPSLPLERLS